MRFNDWEKRLHIFCNKRMHAPAQADFVAGAVLAMTGIDTAIESMPQVSVKMARRGDIVAASDKYGIVSLDGMLALFADEEGLIRVPVLDCDSAWRVV